MASEELSATEIIKKHKKETKDMTRKEFIEKAKTVALTISATLLIAGPFIWYYGVQYGNTNQTEIQNRAKELVSDMTVQTPKN